MVNELSNWMEKYYKPIGVIALILFGLGFYINKTGTQIPIFTGSILGGEFSFLSLGGILFIVGFLLLTLTKKGTTIAFIGLAILVGGLMIAGGSIYTLLKTLLNALSNPIVALIVGLIFAFFIFRKRK